MSPPGGKVLLRTGPGVRPHVRRGQLLLSAQPFVYVLKSDGLRVRCSYCLEKRDHLHRCSGCQVMYFCDRECQKRAWSEFHRSECARLKKVSPRLPPDTALLLARLIVKLRNGGDRISDRITDTRHRSFKDLMSHYRDIKATPRRMEHVAALTVVLRSFLGPDNFPNDSELAGMYGRVCVNGFNILDGEMLPVATGIYLSASIIDHSCQPNAAATFNGRTLSIRATEPIPDFTWEKVRISYIDTMADTETRRRELRNGYFFDCDCVRCSAAAGSAPGGGGGGAAAGLERALRCGSADCPATVPLPPDGAAPRCSRCRYQGYPADIGAEFDEIARLTRTYAQDNTVYYDFCLRLLQRQEAAMLHPLNVYRVKTLDLTLEAAISTDMWERCLELGSKLEDGYRTFYGPCSPLTGIFYLKVGKIALYRFQHALAARWLRRAAAVLRVTHGSDHPVYAEQLAPLLQQLSAETAGRERGDELGDGGD
ncbi:histone-lysine N-methyltransferase SMYD3-like isoform X1 [Amphibalanus amphitrite]|uniref:histone-lysine N-methyltransferase SMYD3-like isoform X1 n=1 Tax=Amphibalanus amphitrite TaxID=1232801 RepID=UPI001C904DB7|nr:histone-lysine N-methyltransferase SMYD3-like isoform X1 [Amphibalanus amphitrite]XP_043237511.1 histone-lysine N-methyltransferase SMYD3-like isoform X1 [Amphibalanus amphitrite]